MDTTFKLSTTSSIPRRSTISSRYEVLINLISGRNDNWLHGSLKKSFFECARDNSGIQIEILKTYKRWCIAKNNNNWN